MKNSEKAARPASAIAMLSGRHCRLSGKHAHARRNPPSNSDNACILQVHHFPLANGVTRQVPTVRTAGSPEFFFRIVRSIATVVLDTRFTLWPNRPYAGVEAHPDIPCVCASGGLLLIVLLNTASPISPFKFDEPIGHGKSCVSALSA